MSIRKWDSDTALLMISLILSLGLLLGLMILGFIDWAKLESIAISQ